MPIFNPIVTISPEQQAAQALIAAGNSLFDLLVGRYGAAYRAVWSNSAATPDKIIAALGTQAAAVFTHAAALAAFINGFGQTQVPTGYPAGWAVSFNADGSATAANTAPAGS